MKWLVFALLCVAAIMTPRAHAESQHEVSCLKGDGQRAQFVSPDGIARCSIAFYFSGRCTGQDSLATFTGPYAIEKPTWSGLRAWEPKSISIVGATIAFTNQIAGFQYAFVGDSYNADPILWAARGSGATTAFFPSGWSLQFPRAGSVDDAAAHIDVHVGCASGSFQGFLTIYDVINPN